MNHLLFVNSFTDSCVCQFHPLSTALSQINAGRMYLHLKCIYLIIYFYEFTIFLNTFLSMRWFLNKEWSGGEGVTNVTRTAMQGAGRGERAKEAKKIYKNSTICDKILKNIKHQFRCFQVNCWAFWSTENEFLIN